MDIERRSIGYGENARNRIVMLQGQVARCNAQFFLLMHKSKYMILQRSSQPLNIICRTRVLHQLDQADTCIDRK